jgi:hypothetical protein
MANLLPGGAGKASTAMGCSEVRDIRLCARDFPTVWGRASALLTEQ